MAARLERVALVRLVADRRPARARPAARARRRSRRDRAARRAAGPRTPPRAPSRRRRCFGVRPPLRRRRGVGFRAVTCSTEASQVWVVTSALAVRGERGDAPRPERRRPGARAPGGMRHRNGIADAGHVVVGDPAAQLDDRRRQKRLAVDDLDDVLDLRSGLIVPGSGVRAPPRSPSPCGSRPARARARRSTEAPDGRERCR